MHAFDFQLPSVTINELFMLYLTKHKLPVTILKKESILSILQNILLDYELMTYDVKCCAMSAVAVAAKMKRVPLCVAPEFS